MTEREQFLSDIIVCAIEGGIGYWSTTLHYCAEGRMVVQGWPAVAEPRTETTWAIVEDIDTGQVFTITPSVIEQGIARILNSEVSYPPFAVDALDLADASNDAGLIDATTADDIVQAALLGAIVYG